MEAAALTAFSREEEHQDGRPKHEAVAGSGTFSSSAALGHFELNRRQCLHHGTAMFPGSGVHREAIYKTGSGNGALSGDVYKAGSGCSFQRL